MNLAKKSVHIVNAIMVAVILSMVSGCGTTEVIVEKPVPVEVVRVERVPVPIDLLIQRNKSTLPDALKYGEALQLWAEDRANLDSVNAQLGAIQGLSNGDQ